MLRKFSIFLLFVSYALSEECVRYTFEDGFNDLFTDERGTCSTAGITTWIFKEYKDTIIDDQPARSTKFISPQETPSCVSSFIFPMSAGGVVEVNVFMDAVENADQVIVLGHQVVNGENDAVVGSTRTSPVESKFVKGWQVLRFTLGGTGTYDGYITIMGLGLLSSTVLVDSFRYIPPGMDESVCELYQRDTETTLQSETDTFWTPLNITLVVLSSVFVIILLFVCCLCCRRNSKVSIAVNA